MRKKARRLRSRKMKLLLENWREYLKEQEDSCDDVVWHGSRADFIGAVRASQAHDVGGHPEQNLVAVYATENKKMAIYMSMVMPDENGKLDIFSDHEKDQLVVVRGDGKVTYTKCQRLLLETQVFVRQSRVGFGKRCRTMRQGSDKCQQLFRIS
jgi:hypothetical protein